MQRRFFAHPDRQVQLRNDEGQPSKIVGYAAVFYREDDPGTEYQLYSGDNYSVVERLLPGCFDRAVKEDDVRALFNHDASAILGRIRSGTLRLSIDNAGLRYEIDPPDTQTARDLVESLKRGDITGSSFCFDYRSKSVIMQSEADGSERDIIEVRDVALFDIGPVTFPAYTSTTSGIRSTDQDALMRELQGLRAERSRNPVAKRARVKLLELEQLV